jgi:iron complex transport system ATP-binding protein
MNERNGDLLALENLTIGYRTGRNQTKTVAENLTAALKPGELICLLGPNGAGKSTLMRTVAGMQQPLAGEVRLENQNIHRIAARELAKMLSVVLTERITVGALSAYALVALGRYPHTNWAGNLTERDHQIIADSLRLVGAADLANRSVAELSDGERQKIMVARALAQEPQVLILDEITAFLDLPRRVDIMRLLGEMTRQTGKAALLSTHDLDLALRSADRLWLLSKDGRFETGAPEDLVLSGAFETAFQGENIDFDRQAGFFRTAQNYRGAIKLNGAGLAAVWTERALERAGFRVDGAAAETTIEIVNAPHKTIWRLRENSNQAGEFDSLYDLTVALTAKNGGTKN